MSLLTSVGSWAGGIVAQVPPVPTPAPISEPAEVDPNALVTPSIDWEALGPLIILGLGAVLLLTIGSLMKRKPFPGFYSGFTVVVAAAAGLATIPLWQNVNETGPYSVVGGAMGIDGFGLFAQRVALTLGLQAFQPLLVVFLDLIDPIGLRQLIERFSL